VKFCEARRRAWLTTCAVAELSGRIPHDFLRTAVRNLERGVPDGRPRGRGGRGGGAGAGVEP
jgi:hypothetical protein